MPCIAPEGTRRPGLATRARVRAASPILDGMALTRDDVLHIARLARIALSDDEVERFRAQLSGILDHFAALAAVDTDGVEPTAHPLTLANVMRDDVIEPSLPRDDVLANAPLAEDGYFRVRAVLE